MIKMKKIFKFNKLFFKKVLQSKLHYDIIAMKKSLSEGFFRLELALGDIKWGKTTKIKIRPL
jgi:hypothetical protein